MKVSIESIWRRRADELRAEAGKYSPGNYRDLLLKQARQLETASHAHGWANSTGLRPPVDENPIKKAGGQ
jgi:hypothetical protein